jgi:hypothetical protein
LFPSFHVLRFGVNPNGREGSPARREAVPAGRTPPCRPGDRTRPRPAVAQVDSAAASGLNTAVGREAASVGEDAGIDPMAARGGGPRRRRPGDRARG